MKKFTLLFVGCFLSALTFAQESLDLDYYLPQDITYDQSIPTPKQVFGHEVGEWHVTHDKLVHYMQTIAQVSDRVSIENRGTTFEGRPILLLTVTSKKNHDNIDAIQAAHIANTEGTSVDIINQPLVIYQGFSIHGNEPSGANAGLAYIYYLAAAQGTYIENALENTVILMDPSFNPDGLQRFSTWANMHKNKQINPDPNDREYREAWPGGRTNHYWFDLNRDWLPAQLPESRARIISFHKWLPNILTDHHEMGTNSSFFFQPGEPSRVNPLTPKENQRLTAEIGSYHAKAFDKLGSFYYSEENYDDFYYGKGSTFPDINGSIGILFEQGSSRGHAQESDNGVLTFPFTIRNQFTAALSTLEAAINMREKLLAYQRDFYSNRRAEAAREKSKAYVFGNPKDPARAWHLAEILERHKIAFYKLNDPLTVSGKKYNEDNSYVVPLNQKNKKLIDAMFNKQTKFQDSLFYDISSWTFPLAFDLDYNTISIIPSSAKKVDQLEPIQGTLIGEGNYAYLFEWHNYYTPKALNKILNKGLRAKVSLKKFSLEGVSYDYGTIEVPVQNQVLDIQELRSFMKAIAEDSGIQIRAVASGYSDGIDLGSNNFRPIKKQEVAILVGDGIASYDAGEIWHLFDQRYEIKLTKLDVTSLSMRDLSRYTNIIIPANYGYGLTKSHAEKLKAWVRNGGNLIAYRSSIRFLDQNELMDLEFNTSDHIANGIDFENKRRFSGAQETGGAIFNAKIDRSHPINYGYTNDHIALFRNTNLYVKADQQSYNNPIQYTATPLISGYHSKRNANLIPNTVPFKVQRLGSGHVMMFTDNTNFRAFWYGTNKLLANAIFFGDHM